MTIWSLPALVDHVVDGDTLSVRFDLGFRIYYDNRVRVAFINAPELSTPAGQTAAAFARSLIAPGAQVTVISHRLDNYGRALGTVSLPEPYTAPDGRTTSDLGEAMLWSGNAVDYRP